MNKEEEKITVAYALRWLSKLEKLSSSGAKLVYVKHLLDSIREETQEVIKLGNNLKTK